MGVLPPRFHSIQIRSLVPPWACTENFIAPVINSTCGNMEVLIQENMLSSTPIMSRLIWSVQSYSFGNSGPHVKLQNPRTTPSKRKVWSVVICREVQFYARGVRLYAGGTQLYAGGAQLYAKVVLLYAWRPQLYAEERRSMLQWFLATNTICLRCRRAANALNSV